jgi:hypothetical protein
MLPNECGPTEQNQQLFVDTYGKIAKLYSLLKDQVQIVELKRIFPKQFEEIEKLESEFRTKKDTLLTNGIRDRCLQIYQLWQTMIYAILKKNPSIAEMPPPEATGFCKIGRIDLFTQNYIDIGFITFDEWDGYEAKTMTVKQIKENHDREFDKKQGRRISNQLVWGPLSLQDDGSYRKTRL